MKKEMRFRFSKRKQPRKDSESKKSEKAKERTETSAEKKELDALWLQAVKYADSGRFDEAKMIFQQIQKDNEDPVIIGSCHLAMGQLEEKRRDFISAAQHYRDGLALKTTEVHAQYFFNNNLGYSLNQLGKPKEAIPYLKRAKEVSPHLPNAYKNLALSYQALGDIKNAAELFIQATQVDASDSRSLRHLDELLRENPGLRVEIPDLEERLLMCRAAVKATRSGALKETLH